jgi:mycothiol system anti-sigma-R factor
VSAGEGCAGIWRFIDTYLDGEFGDVERAELEAHLEGCEPCRARMREQASWKQAVRAAAPRERAPEALRSRLQLQIAELAARPTAPAAPMGSGPAQPEVIPLRRSVAARLLSWSPYAAAAAVAAAVLVTRGQHGAVTADILAKHQRNLPLEISGRSSDEVRRWYADKVDFPVRPPSFPSSPISGTSPTSGIQHVALRGGRLANVRDRQAAYLQYDVDGNKVSVFIFDPGELAFEARRHAFIGDREVFFDGERGYNVALYRDHGVGYAIASDLDQGQMLQLVSAAVSH